MTDAHAVAVGVLFITVLIHASLAYLLGLISRYIRRVERRPRPRSSGRRRPRIRDLPDDGPALTCP